MQGLHNALKLLHNIHVTRFLLLRSKKYKMWYFPAKKYKRMKYLLVIFIVAYFYFRNGSKASLEEISSNIEMKSVINKSPLPSYFISHGGPTFMYTTPGSTGSEGAYSTLQKLGKKIVSTYKPDYIVVVSAHWQSSGTNSIEISIPKDGSGVNNLVYDFYGFPSYMYKEKFVSKNDLNIANSIKAVLEEDGFKARLTKRGIDHGVWVPFKPLFSKYIRNQGTPLEDGEFDLDIPIIQVSLTSNEKDFDTHYKLGQTLNKLRLNNIFNNATDSYLSSLIITSGMSVHNLRDLGIAMLQSKPLSYVNPFNKLLTKTLTSSADRLEGLKNLQTEHKQLLHSAHPTLEHFVPVVISAGVASEGDEKITEMYNADEMSLGWGIYRVGDEK